MDKLLRQLNQEWANRSWTGEGEPFQPASPVMPPSRTKTFDLTRSGFGGTADWLLLWAGPRRAA